MSERAPATARLALLAAAATGVQVGAAMVVTRFVVTDFGPASLALLRYTIGAACLLPLAVAARQRVARRDLVPVAALGIVQFGILIALLNVGLQHLPATRAALLFNTFPLMTMALAAALGRERLRASGVLGLAMCLAGVAVVLGEGVFGAATVHSTGDWLGVAAVLASAACGAACAVLYRPYLARNPALAVGTVAMLASVAFLLVPAAGESLFSTPPALRPAAVAAVAFIGLSSGAGYLAWLWALRHRAASEVTAFLALSPPTAALLGAAWLGEPITVGTLAGIAGIAGGLWVATRSRA